MCIDKFCRQCVCVCACVRVRVLVGWEMQGHRGMWRGFGPCVLRSFPANAVTFLVYEHVTDWLGAV